MELLGGSLLAGDAAALGAAPRRVLDPRDVDLLSDVSARLMRDPAAKALPDVMSFAFWCRRGHLRSLAGSRGDLSHNMGRGLSFHVAPSNVPVNFAFSWAFALLAGNACVVRVPSRPFPQVGAICAAAGAAMAEAGDSRTAFLSYDASSSLTEGLCALADVRVLWGGDATVSRIRAMACRPRCVDVAFADRYSVALLDARAVGALDAAGLRRLAEGFYNDTYLMDQNACSSPSTIAWVNPCDEGKAAFWGAVGSLAREKYALQGAVATDKYVRLCRDAMEGRIAGRARFDGWLDVVPLDVASLPAGSLGGYRGRGGYFYEVDVGGFADLAPLLDRPCQTVTYFGCDPEEVRGQVLSSGMAGVDRVVPVGKAMDIDVVWDGTDLLSVMSRRVDVR